MGVARPFSDAGRNTATAVPRLRARAPLRLGLAGGGTDVSPYSEDFGGAVLNATIGRHAYAFIEPSPDGKLHFIAADLGVMETLSADLDAVMDAQLKLHAAVWRRMMRDYNGSYPLALTLRTSVDAPAGSGLGSSSALVVSLVAAFRALLQAPLGPYDIAHLAYEIERIDLNLAGGKQDQYAAVFGGVNYIEFLAGDRVIVNPLRIPRDVLNELQSSLVTCFSGVSRRSDEIISQQRQGMMARFATTIDSLHQLKADALDMKQALLRGHVWEISRILERSWRAKQKTAAGVSTELIDSLYETAIRAGALAGKVSGAGGGGFIMFLAPPEQRLSVIAALNEAGGEAAGAQITSRGVESWVAPNAL